MKVDISFILFLVLAAVFLSLAAITKVFPAKKPNAWYGYRTDRSRRNRRNWNFAQGLLPLMFLRLSLYQVVGAIIWYLIPPPGDTVGLAAVFGLLFATLTLEIYLSEKALKRFSRKRR